MELVDFLLSGVDFGVTHSLLLLLLLADDFITDEIIEEKVNDYMQSFKGHKDWGSIRQFAQLVYNDRFTKETYSDMNLWHLRRKIDSLRNEILEFFKTSISDLVQNDKEIERVCDIDLKLGRYLIQLFRLRLVIQPQYGLSITTNPKTEVQYMNVKAYWRDDNNKPIRKFNKSLGLASNYPNGIKDEEALADGLKLIREVLMEEYSKIYPD